MSVFTFTEGPQGVCAVLRRRFSVGESPTRQFSPQPVAIGAVMELTKWLGDLAMFASCERAVEAGCRSGKLSRVGFSQPLGSVMPGQRELVRQRSEGSEVKGVGAADKAAIPAGE